MTTEIPEPELTDTQKAYNVAQCALFQLAAYGHCTYTNGEMLTDEGKRQQYDYNDRIRQAREDLEAAVLRLVAEHAESLRGDWGVVAAWLRSLADDPAELSLLAVRPDEREDDAVPAAVSVPPPTGTGRRAQLLDALDFAYCQGLGYDTPEALLDAYDASRGVPVPPSADQAALRDRIAEALYAHDHLGWRVSLRESDVEPVYRERAAAVLAFLPEQADRAAVLEEAAQIAVADNQTCPAVYQCQPCLTRERVAAVLLRAAATTRRVAAEEQQAETQGADRPAVLLEIAATLDGLAETDMVRKRRSLGTARRLLAGELRKMAAEPAAERSAVGEQPAPCAECGHPRTVHREGDDPVTPGECSACPDDDARHDYRRAVGEQPDTQETPVRPCNYWTYTRIEHTPHRWVPQPGMDPVHCPGYDKAPE